MVNWAEFWLYFEQGLDNEVMICLQESADISINLIKQHRNKTLPHQMADVANAIFVQKKSVKIIHSKLH